jgi:hypothetical protein
MVHIYTDHKSLKYIFTQLDLNMWQRRWLELIKDHELEVQLLAHCMFFGKGIYHPSVTGIVSVQHHSNINFEE